MVEPGPVGVHCEEHAGPFLGLGAPAARLDGQDGRPVVGIVGVGAGAGGYGVSGGLLLAVQQPGDALALLVQVVVEGVVLLLGGQVGQVLEGLDAVDDVPALFQRVVEFLCPLGAPEGCLVVGPVVRAQGPLLEELQFLSQAGEVKAAP